MNGEFILQAKGICKSYQDGDKLINVLRHSDLALKEGEFIAILGPSGCGKSTLLHVLGLISKADSGEIIIDGNPVSTKSAAERARIRNAFYGYVVQDYALLEDETARYNIELPLRYTSQKRLKRKKAARCRELMARLDIGDKEKTLVRRLSGGQRQRVAVARALVCEPKVILADEPTGSLDAENSEEVFMLLRSLANDGKSIIMVTHNRNLAKRCDRILTMKNGQLTEGISED